MDKSMENREFHDSLFKIIFRDEENQRELFYSLFRQEPGTIETITLESLFVQTLRNDLGLMADNKLLVLIEAQSTEPANIALRMLFYLADTLKKYTRRHIGHALYGSTPVSLPDLRLYVVCTFDTGALFYDLARLLPEEAGHYVNLYVDVLSENTVPEDSLLYMYIRLCKERDRLKREGASVAEVYDELLALSAGNSRMYRTLGKYEEEVKQMVSFEEARRMEVELGRDEGRAIGRAEGRAEGQDEVIRRAAEVFGMSYEEARKKLLGNKPLGSSVDTLKLGHK